MAFVGLAAAAAAEEPTIPSVDEIQGSIRRKEALLDDPQTALADAAKRVGSTFDVGSLELVLQTIQSAQQEVLVAVYAFTSKPIVLALLKVHKRGVDVRLVVDEKSNRHYTDAQFLANGDAPVRADSHYSIMHEKFSNPSSFQAHLFFLIQIAKSPHAPIH